MPDPDQAPHFRVVLPERHRGAMQGFRGQVFARFGDEEIPLHHVTGVNANLEVRDATEVTIKFLGSIEIVYED